VRVDPHHRPRRGLLAAKHLVKPVEVERVLLDFKLPLPRAERRRGFEGFKFSGVIYLEYGVFGPSTQHTKVNERSWLKSTRNSRPRRPRLSPKQCLRASWPDLVAISIAGAAFLGQPVERFSVTSHPHTGRRAIYGGHCKNLASISGEYQGKSGVISRVMQPLKNAAQ